MSAADLTDSGAPSASATTYNGNPSYATIGKPHIDYFAGVTRQTPDSEISRLAQSCFDSDQRLAIATFFQKRDCRGGAGERKPFILSFKVLPADLRERLYSIVPQFGYWDDLNSFARAIPEDRSVIAGLFATYLRDNIVGFETGVLHRPLEKWLPTEGQQDDKTWGAVKKIVKAFNRQFDKEAPFDLRTRVLKKLGKDLEKQVKKLDFHAEVVPGERTVWRVKETEGYPWSEETTSKIKEVTARFGHIATKAQVLPTFFSKLSLTDYRKWCSFMRAYFEVLEHYKSEGEWDLIDFSKIPSIAFDRNKEQFQEHIPEKFTAFMKKVESGEEKINVGRLMPFQLIPRPSSEVRDIQWRLIVEETKKFYTEVPLDNIFHPQNVIHVADVSGSMITTSMNPRPIDVALSLTFLGAEVGKRACYTFSTTSKRYEPTWTSLTEAQAIFRDSNCSTNFRSLIDRIFDDCMKEADKKGVPPSQCFPGSIFIYTDGGFDQMCRESPTSAADYLTSKFDGFSKIPVVVFWNVAGNLSDFTTTTEHQKIVQLAGFSKDLYKIFTRLTSIDGLGPEILFKKAVLTERYEIPLAVYDSWKASQPNDGSW